MDYSQILHELRAASLFDLYRLRVAIDQQLDNPDRLQEVKRRLRPGKEITYFDEVENRLVEATVISLHRARLLVENKHDRKRWSIRFCTVNSDDVETDIHTLSGHKNVDRSQLRVGDHVGFYNRQNQELYGEIIRLNNKTATILVNDGSRWRVAYQFLFKVIEGY